MNPLQDHQGESQLRGRSGHQLLAVVSAHLTQGLVLLGTSGHQGVSIQEGNRGELQEGGEQAKLGLQEEVEQAVSLLQPRRNEEGLQAAKSPSLKAIIRIIMLLIIMVATLRMRKSMR